MPSVLGYDYMNEPWVGDFFSQPNLLLPGVAGEFMMGIPGEFMMRMASEDPPKAYERCMQAGEGEGKMLRCG